MKATLLQKSRRRVDYQVSIIIAVVVALSFLCVYIYNYNVTYADMLASLRSRSDSIYTYVEDNFDSDTYFAANQKDDINQVGYHDGKEFLEGVKESAGVMYLYTAKRNDKGQFVYVLDGLPSDSPDFRYPGDLIEPEIIPEMEMALKNKIVYPDDIKVTQWGKILVSYYPIHENGKVIGVIGIEFDASRQYQTFQQIRIVTPIIGVLFAMFAVIISLFLFRRISNPSFKDFSNTDYLTSVKNRNSFELDVTNFHEHEFEHGGFVCIDLNDLKVINDEQGHQSGDAYIKACAQILMAFESNETTLYRIGGDEFVLLVTKTSQEELQQIIAKIKEAIQQYNANHITKLSLALGAACFDETLDASAYDTFNRADADMYEHKKAMKAKQKNNNN